MSVRAVVTSPSYRYEAARNTYSTWILRFQKFDVCCDWFHRLKRYELLPFLEWLHLFCRYFITLFLDQKVCIIFDEFYITCMKSLPLRQDHETRRLENPFYPLKIARTWLLLANQVCKSIHKQDILRLVLSTVSRVVRFPSLGRDLIFSRLKSKAPFLNVYFFKFCPIFCHRIRNKKDFQSCFKRNILNGIHKLLFRSELKNVPWSLAFTSISSSV